MASAEVAPGSPPSVNSNEVLEVCEKRVCVAGLKSGRLERGLKAG